MQEQELLPSHWSVFSPRVLSLADICHSDSGWGQDIIPLWPTFARTRPGLDLSSDFLYKNPMEIMDHAENVLGMF